MSQVPLSGNGGVSGFYGYVGKAADLAGETGARLVIPGHWDMFADNSADPGAFADYLDVKYHGKVTCLIPEVMEKIVYGDGGLHDDGV